MAATPRVRAATHVAIPPPLRLSSRRDPRKRSRPQPGGAARPVFVNRKDGRVDELKTELLEEIGRASDGEMARFVEINTQTLCQLINEFRGLRQAVLEMPIGQEGTCEVEGPCEAGGQHRGKDEGNDAELRQTIRELERELDELREQNEDLAARLASSQVKRSMGSGGNAGETLSWEQRKALILRQMEDDSFDAEAFVAKIGESHSGADDPNEPGPGEDPVQYVRQLHRRLQRQDNQLKRRDQEIDELRNLLEQQAATAGDGMAVGAAAIAQMMDEDELVREERQRLQDLQQEWEAKFREAEVAASLERAKLSRERQELAQKMAELDDQLAQAKAANREVTAEGPQRARRWMTALGIQSDDDG